MAAMFLAHPTTTTPSCTSLLDSSYPIPEDAPVTIATRSSLPPLYPRVVEIVDSTLCGTRHFDLSLSSTI